MAQGRRARLVIRRIEPLTVLKVSVLFWASVYVILLVAAVMLWSAATATGLRDNVESFVGELIAAEDFKFEADQILRASVVGGAVLVALGSFATVMMAVLYNLIADVVGGIAIIFEETAGRRERRQAGKAVTARSSLGKIGSKLATSAKAAATTEPQPRSGSQPQRASPGQR